ncbi:hypothetical protein A9Q87_10145 [Flavobacteriales bacterium 34_180_T64]|nr:hypothetical protein A9Q87_10145 [Flavobacteriales bacterium 34_180_T64]
MERTYVIKLVVISFLLTNSVAFLDEGIRTFDYLKHIGDWIALLIYTLLFSILPILIFFMSKKNFKDRFYWSLLGFIPVALLIFFQL